MTPSRNRRQRLARKQATQQKKQRHLHHETLERRELLAAEIQSFDAELFNEPHAHPVFAPGTKPEVVDFWEDQHGPLEEDLNSLTSPINLGGTRWTNPTGGPSANQGDGAVVTWSIVPDGTPVAGSATGPSDLVAFMDGIYGGGGATIADRPWFPLFEDIYDNWSTLTGLEFVYEPSDDGAAQGGTNRGVTGVRGDVRVAGAFIDGNSNVLAYNFFPNAGGNAGADGDMVIDTGDNFYLNNADGPTGENRGLINVLGHEAGHGIGLGHVIPTDGTKLMEPFINLGFLGPQHDDILAAQTLYGDRFSDNDTQGTAVHIGSLDIANIQLENVSIDDNNDVDWYSFDASGGSLLRVDLSPDGFAYQNGPQGGNPSAFDSSILSDLRFDVFGPDGALVAREDRTGVGESEQLPDVQLTQTGTYTIGVYGDSSLPPANGTNTQTQLYNLDIASLPGDLKIAFPRTNSAPDPTRPSLIGVGPHDGLLLELDIDDQPTALTQSPNELTLSFDGRFRLDANSLSDIENLYVQYTEHRTTNAFGFEVGDFPTPNLSDPQSDPSLLNIGHREFNDSFNQVTLRFAESLRDGFYRVVITDGVVGDDNTTSVVESRPFLPSVADATEQEVHFQLELGASVVSVVPQPLDVNQDKDAGTVEILENRNAIDVYFDDADLFDNGSTIHTLNYYQLIDTKGTVEYDDDVNLGSPISVVTPAQRGEGTEGAELLPSQRWVRLVFGSELDVLAGASTTETLRLRIGDSIDPTTVILKTDDTGNEDLGVIGDRFSLKVEGQSISGEYLDVDYPGSGDAAGHRDIAIEDHLLFGADASPGISTVYYSFSKGVPYGASSTSVIPNLNNQMTEDMEQRFREVFGILGATFGIDFVETPDNRLPTADPSSPFATSLRVVVGDMFPTAIAPGDAAATNAIGDGNLANYLHIHPVTGEDVNLLVFDGNENFYEGFGDSPDPNRPSIFNAALGEIMRVLGLNDPSDLPRGSYLGFTPTIAASGGIEWVFPGNSDVVHGQHLYKPESLDVDLYEFELSVAGNLNAEIVANRLADASTLDARMALFQQVSDAFGDSRWELVAVNDDYFGRDPFIELTLSSGIYALGIAAEGNSFDPNSSGHGSGGTSEGEYDLRLDFIPTADQINNLAMMDADGSIFDGDRDGHEGGNYNFWFNVAPERVSGASPSAAADEVIFVHKGFTGTSTGGPNAPYNNLGVAIGRASAGDIIRVLGDKGFDDDIVTPIDSDAYLVGRSGATLPDGANVEIPAGVTLMIDGGAVFKMSDSRIVVGSDEASERLGSAIQVLGTPGNQVYFTSYQDDVNGIGTQSNPTNQVLAPGDWGGIEIRGDVDRASGRVDLEREGVFINYINHAYLNYGGGSVSGRTIAPIDVSSQRPEISFNTILNSGSAAISADPNAFEFTTFTENRYQQFGEFVPDYDRVGPDFYRNQLERNAQNGVFISIETLPGGRLEQLQVSARLDDDDIVHILSENLLLDGSPGGPFTEFDPVGPSQGTRPAVSSLTVSTIESGNLTDGTYTYTYTFVDAFGNESLPSQPKTYVLGGTTDGSGSLRINNLPRAGGDFVGRRIYRQDVGSPDFVLLAEIDGVANSFTDHGNHTFRTGATIPANDPLFSDGASFRRGLRDAGLVIDPGLVIKSGGARIELGMGTTLLAEGNQGDEIIFTSLADDRYGRGGTFDTNNNVSVPGSDTDGEIGDWGGIYAGRLSRLSLDHGVIANAGGVVGLVGTTGAFNAVEIHEAEARIANTLFERIASGQGGATNEVREGRGPNDEAIIYVVGAQPILVGNTFDGDDDADNVNPASGATSDGVVAISINADSLNAEFVSDIGRQTGIVDIFPGTIGNQGPLVRGNQMERVFLNAMHIREQTLTTESVWDDTDIVHLVAGEINIPNFHTAGGLRLQSSNDESLVVKLFGDDAGFTAGGLPLDINDRIGGRLHVIGTPGFPVILTSVNDPSVGAGFDPKGLPQRATNNVASAGDGLPIGPEVDNGTTIDNDTAVTTTGFFEVTPRGGGDIASSRVTIDGNTGQIVGADFIFDFNNFIDVGGNGNGINLQTSTITTPPTLIGDDHVISEGTITGNGGAVVRWRAETTIEDGETVVFNRIFLDSDAPLGDLRFINYLDQDVTVSSDILYPAGTPGQDDFRAFTLGNAARAGFSQGGIYQPAPGQLENATYAGWAADAYPQLLNVIGAAGTTYTVAGNIDTTDLPVINDPDLGTIYGPRDVTTAFAWDVDPLATSATITSFLELIPRNPNASAGEWKGITLNEYSHDRNVETIIELETDISGFGDTNDDPALNAQDIGRLATGEKSSDENFRLGFTINGAIAVPGDVDVYEFEGTAGTQVWIDIDRTEFGLDSVVELVDIDGNIIALSDNSRAENADVDNLPAYMGAGLPMQSDPLALRNVDGSYQDAYSINDRDAGFRVVLPGTEGNKRPYFIRVRSAQNSIADLMDDSRIDRGKTQGSYQLQLRLREQDEFAGSTIRHADIRFATTGIELVGLPAHSPLGGSVHHAGGNNVIDAGNVGQSDRGLISAAGSVNGNQNGFNFSVSTPAVVTDPNALSPTVEEVPGAIDNTFDRVSVSIDVDYADANTTAYLFNGDHLIAIGTDSNILDDRTIPITPIDETDLSRGSDSVSDPFIGPIELRTSGDYSVYVSSNNQIANVLNQYTNAGSANTGIRLEPIDGYNRIVDERFSANGAADVQAQSGNPSDLTALQPVFGTGDATIHKWHLGDIPLLAVTGNALNVFNAFTGRQDSRLVPDINTNLNAVSNPIRDIVAFAGNPDGQMFGIVENPNGNNVFSDATDVRFISADASIATSANQIQTNTFEAAISAATPPVITAVASPNASAAEGLSFKAVTYWNNPNTVARDTGNLRRLYAVADRNDFNGVTVSAFTGQQGNTVGITGAVPNVPVQQRTNMIFMLDPDTGSVINRYNGQNRNGIPAQFAAASPNNYFANDRNGGTTGALNGQTGVPEYVPFSGTDVVGQVVVPTIGSVTSVASNETSVFAFTDLGEIFRYDVIDSGNAFGDLVPNDLADPATPGAETGRILDVDGNLLTFAAVTSGPINHELIDDGDDDTITRYFFGVKAGTDELYAFNLDDIESGDATAVRVFRNAAGQTSLQNFDSSDVAGLYFSPLDQNLWHLSDTTATEPGHGVPPFNGDLTNPYVNNNEASRPNRNGGGSLFFGFDPLDDDFNHLSENRIYPQPSNGNQFVPGTQPFGFDNGTAFPGGAYGTIESKSIDLSSIAADDLPFLYFNYKLGSEDAEIDGPNNNPNEFMRDSLRVLVSGDDNQWKLVATNNAGHVQNGNTNTPDYQEFNSLYSGGYFDSVNQVYVQELFDDGNNYRQARIDLAPFAGNKNVNIRFEYSSAGELRPDQSELHGVPGKLIEDGYTFEIEGRTFEFDLGLVLDLPSGENLSDGDRLQYTSGGVTRTLFEFTSGVPSASQVNFSDNDSATDITNKVLAYLNTTLNPLIGDLSATSDPEAPSRISMPNVNKDVTYSTVGLPPEFLVSTPGLSVPSNFPVNIARSDTASMVRDAMVESLINSTLVDPAVVGTPDASVAFPTIGDAGIRIYSGINQAGDTLAVINGQDYGGAHPGSPFGLYNDEDGDSFADPANVQITENNAASSVHIDDIVIGLAERGEMVIGAPADNTFINNPANQVLPENNQTFNTYRRALSGVGPGTGIVTQTDYQLEIRTSREYADNAPSGLLARPIDSYYSPNQRLAEGVSIFVAHAGAGITDADYFTLSNGVETIEFEYNDVGNDGLGGDGILDPSRIAIDYRPIDTRGEIAARIIEAINRPGVQSILGIRATTSGGLLVDTSDSVIALHGRASADVFGRVDFDPVNNASNEFDIRIADMQKLIDLSPNSDPIVFHLVDDDLGLRRTFQFVKNPGGDYPNAFANTSRININNVTDSSIVAARLLDALNAQGFAVAANQPSSGNSVRIVLKNPLGFVSGSDAIQAGYLDHLVGIVNGGDDVKGEDLSDANRFIDQGQIIIQATSVFASSNYGIDARATTDANGLPLPGPVRNLPVDNTANLLPGVVLQNNLLVGNQQGGIRIAGGGPNDNVSAPFARVVNNTVFGAEQPNGIGIRIENGAAPTLMNNAIANTNNAISRSGNTDPNQIVVLGTLFQDNNTNLPAGLVDPFQFVVTTPGGTSQFRDTMFGGGGTPYEVNFYPNEVIDSLLIDSSMKSREERSELDNVKTAVGIAPSPIIAPDTDLVGRKRLNDPLVNPNIGGQGSSVFQDRGALDSSDDEGPIARLLRPLDNDSADLDNELLVTTVFRGDDINNPSDVSELSDSLLTHFAIQLIEPTGIGPDINTISSDQVIVTENGRLLSEGAEYTFGYSISSRQIRLTPTAGLWKPDAVYEITLLNEDHLRVDTNSPTNSLDTGTGFDIADGDQLEVVGDVPVTFEYDSGYVLQLGQPLVIEVNSGIGNTGVRFGDTVTLEYDVDQDRLTDNSRTVVLEFVAPGDSANAGNIPVPVALGFTPDQVSDALLAALQGDISGGGQTIRDYLVINPFRIPGGIQLNAFLRQTVSVENTNGSITSIGNTFSVTDGHRFSYTTAGGIDGLTQQFRIDVINDIGTAETQVTEDRLLDNDSIVSVADASGFAAGDFIRVASEIMLISSVAGNDLTVARAQLGSKAALAYAGAEVVLLQPSGITSVAATADATSATIEVHDAVALGVSPGDYVRVGTEIVRVDVVTGDQLTVTRGQLGTDGVVHAANTVVALVRSQRTTTLDEMRIGPSGQPEPATLLPNDTVIEVIKLDTFDPINGDLLRIGDEVLTIIDIVDNGTTLSITVDRGAFDTPVVEVPVGSEVTVIDSNIAPIYLFATDTLDDRDVEPNGVRIGVASKIARTLREFGDADSDTDLRLPHAQGIDNGRVYLGGQVGDVVNLRSGMDDGLGAAIIAEPGVTGGLSLVIPDAIDIPGLDGEQLTITDSSVTPAVTTTFEFSLDANVPLGVELVRINNVASPSELVAQLAQAIANANIGLSPTADPNDANVLRLNESFQISIDTMSTGFGTVGVTGGAVPIPFIPDVSFPAEAVAAGLLDAITHQPALGLTGFAVGGGRFYLKSDGSTNLSADQIVLTPLGRLDIGQEAIVGIKDLAGNNLQPNRPVDQTKFTILLGEQELDYGDADSIRSPGRAPQTRSEVIAAGIQNDAARHVILTGIGFESDPKLGRVVDGEVNGVPSVGADSDDDSATGTISVSVDENATRVTVAGIAGFAGRENDFVQIDDEYLKIVAIDGNELVVLRGQAGTVNVSHSAGTTVELVDDEEGVTLDSLRAVFNASLNGEQTALIDLEVSDYGVIDAWVDWNRDGDFSDSFERQLSRVSVWPGMTSLPIRVPTQSDIGFDVTGPAFGTDAILRVRVSQNGGLRADQIAVGGEIEDHLIHLIRGTEPDVDTDLPNNGNPTFVWDEDANGGLFDSSTGSTFNPANPNHGVIPPGATDADGDAIFALEVVNPHTGRVSIVADGGTLVGLQDSLGRTAGNLTMTTDGNFTFDTVADYNTQTLKGPDQIVGTADDGPTPELTFLYRIVDATGVPSTEFGTVTLVVNPVNDVPTIDDPSDFVPPADFVGANALNEDDPTQTVNLSGITTGAGETQQLRVYSTSDNTLLIPDPSVIYDGIETTGTLSFTPEKDIYGDAVITIFVEDGGIDGDLSTTTDNDTTSVSFTVTVNPVNDAPIAHDRAFQGTEAHEAGGDDPNTEPFVIPFTKADLLNGNASDGETPVQPGPTVAISPYDEGNQVTPLDASSPMQVVRFEFPVTSGLAAIDVLTDETNLIAGSGYAVRTTSTGTLRFNFSGGQFVDGLYTPFPEYNRQIEFPAVAETFSYVILDDGVSILPGPGGTPSTIVEPKRSAPAEISLTIVETNDAPVFPPSFDHNPAIVEIEPGDTPEVVVDIIPEASELITPGPLTPPLTSLDELAQQDVTIEFIPVNIPGGTVAVPYGPDSLMAQAPVLLADGTLMIYPTPDAFGKAVFDVQVTDFNRDASPLTSHTTTERITITVAGTNDKPIAQDFAKSVLEAVEAVGESTADPAFQITFTAQELLDIGGPRTSLPHERHATINGLFDESEQDLEVVEFVIPNPAGGADIIVNDTTSGVITPNGGTLSFTFAGGVFVQGVYEPATDYNETTPYFDATDVFGYIIADSGLVEVPGSDFVNAPAASDQVDLGSLRSDPATIAFSVMPANDAPAFPASFEYTPFTLEIEPRPIPFVSIDIIPGFTDRITPGPLTALDELDETNQQTTRIELVPVNIPGGTPTDPYGPTSLLTQPATLSADGVLRMFPRPDAFGVAVFDIVVTDTLPDGSPLPGSLTTTERLTVTFEGTNDQPVAQDYTRTITEAAEGLGESTSDPAFQIAFTAEDLLDIGGPRSAVAHLRNGIVPDLFDESQQVLDVVEFLIPNPAGGADIVVNSTTNNVITTTGGKLSFTFDVDVFVSGVFEPAIDYNNTVPYFAAPESFQYIIRDSGPIDVPGTDFINAPGPADKVNHFMVRSEPADITFNVIQRNDPPVIPPFAEIPVQTEFEPGGQTSFTFDLLADDASLITAGPLTALDEMDQQDIVITVAAINVPGSIPNTFGPNSLLMRQPTLTADGILTVFPTPDAYGIAILEVQVTDTLAGGGALADSLTTTQLVTITINGVNDRPVAYDRSFSQVEAVESLGESTSDPAHQIRFTKADLLRRDLTADGNDPEPAYTHPRQGEVDATFDEREQALKIVSVADGNEFIQANVDGVRTMTTASGGRIDFTFAGGELVEGVYTPARDFNQNTPFLTDDIFTFVVEDSGLVTNPGADFAADPAIPTSIDLGTLASEPATVTLTILPVNDPPIFSGANDVLVSEDAGPRTIARWATGIQAGPAGANDELQDPPAELTFDLTLISGDPSLFASPPVAAISGSDATLSFETSADRNGVAVYEVQLREIDGPSNPANGDTPVSAKQTFTITVNPINDPPTFTAGGVVTVDEDSAAYRAPWATDISTGPAEEPTTQTIDRFVLSLPAGTENLFATQPTIDIDGTLSFAPANNAAGDVMIDVAAVDSEGLSSATQTLTIRIVDFDDSPVPFNDELDSNEDDVLVIESAEILQNDIDPDLLTNPNESLSVVLPAQLTTSLGSTVTFDETTGKITYDPTTSQSLQELAPGESLVDRFIYGVTDADEEDPLPTAEVILTIAGRNDAPVPGDDVLSVSPDATTILSPLVNDTDIDGTIDPASIIITEQPTQGSLSIETNGTLLYTPGVGFSGLDSFRYTVGDNLGQQSQQATINVSASGAPDTGDDLSGTFTGGPVDIDVLSNDTTNAGTLDPSTIVITTPPTNGTAVPQADGTIRYTPNGGFTGEDTFVYTVADTSGRISNGATVSVNVVQSNLQNPRNFMDVNASGTVTSLDALLIVNRLSRAGNVSNIPVQSPDRGPNYYDVSGDLNISAGDALRVINYLSRQGPGGESESIVDASSIASAPIASASVASASVAAALEESETAERTDDGGQPGAAAFADAADKVIATSRLDSTPLELIDLIAQEQGDEDDDDRIDAIDAAIQSLV